MAGDYDKAKEVALEMRELFGEDGYYLELQDHNIPAQKKVNEGILRLHEETGIPLVCTNDAHYLRREDAEMQDILMCIQMGKTVDDPGRMKFETQEFYVKSKEEMAALFPREALDNTAKIAELCNVDFTFGKYHLPHFQLPEGWSDGYAYFEKLCLDGFAWRYPDQPPEYRNLYQRSMQIRWQLTQSRGLLMVVSVQMVMERMLVIELPQEMVWRTLMVMAPAQTTNRQRSGLWRADRWWILLNMARMRFVYIQSNIADIWWMKTGGSYL